MFTEVQFAGSGLPLGVSCEVDDAWEMIRSEVVINQAVGEDLGKDRAFGGEFIEAIIFGIIEIGDDAGAAVVVIRGQGGDDLGGGGAGKEIGIGPGA